jgi:hypothetical protein
LNNYCNYDFNSKLYVNGTYNILGLVRETSTTEMYHVANYSEDFNIANTVVNSIVINGGENLDGVTYDVTANITGGSAPTFKCYSGVGDGSSCSSNDWDCKVGSLSYVSGNTWAGYASGLTKDTSGTWTCKVTDSGSTLSQTTTMNEITGSSIISTTGIYSGLPNTTNNPILMSDGNAYFTVYNTGNVSIDVKATGNNFVFGANTIALSNQKWALTNDSGAATIYTGSLDTLKTSLVAGTYPTSGSQFVYEWLDIPVSKLPGTYTSVTVVEVSQS